MKCCICIKESHSGKEEEVTNEDVDDGKFKAILTVLHFSQQISLCCDRIVAISNSSLNSLSIELGVLQWHLPATWLDLLCANSIKIHL